MGERTKHIRTIYKRFMCKSRSTSRYRVLPLSSNQEGQQMGKISYTPDGEGENLHSVEEGKSETSICILCLFLWEEGGGEIIR